MSDPTQLQKPQPAPTGDGVPVWPAVMADLQERPLRQFRHLVPHMQARHEFGLAKYGTPLKTNNGRDAMVDALQEALDLVAYLSQLLLELPEAQEDDPITEGLKDLNARAISLASNLVYNIEARKL